MKSYLILARDDDDDDEDYDDEAAREQGNTPSDTGDSAGDNFQGDK